MKQLQQKPANEKLADVALFKELSKSELTRVAEAGRLKKIPDGSFFFQEGDPANQIYVLIEGKVRLSQVTQEGQQVILRYIVPVEAFGILAVLTDQEFHVSAQAVGESTALTWDRDSMNFLMTQIPQIARNSISVLAGRVKEFQDKLRELATERVERRIARTLLRFVRQAGRKVPEGVLIDLPLSRQDLAEMTGTTLFTVSRTLSSWESQGIVKSTRERIVITFPHGLVRIAEDLRPERSE